MPNPHWPKVLTHSLQAHIVQIQRIQHEHTHIHTDPTSPPPHTHTPAAYIMAEGLKKKFLKRESFSRKIEKN